MATSNVTGVLDPAFLDRADIRAFIGPPSAVAIYAIYCSCLNELIRVGLIQRQKSGFLSYRVLSALQFADNSVSLFILFYCEDLLRTSLPLLRIFDSFHFGVDLEMLLLMMTVIARKTENSSQVVVNRSK